MTDARIKRLALLDKEFVLLSGICDKLVKEKYPAERKKLGRYNKFYSFLSKDITEKSDFDIPFQSFFGRYRNNILRTGTNDEWLKNHDLHFNVLEGKKVDNPPKKPVIFNIGKFYSIARENKSIREGLMAKFGGGDDDNELIVPEIIKLHLLKIFYITCDNGDKRSLLESINGIENLLNVPIGHRTASTIPLPEGLADHSSFQSRLANMDMNTLGKTGIQLMKDSMPENEVIQNIPAEVDFMGIFKGIVGSGAFKDTMGMAVNMIEGKGGDLNAIMAKGKEILEVPELAPVKGIIKGLTSERPDGEDEKTKDETLALPSSNALHSSQEPVEQDVPTGPVSPVVVRTKKTKNESIMDELD